MSTDTTITIVGNLTTDPELAFTGTGVAYAKFSIASTPRRYDKATGEWVDGETLFLHATCWRDQASNIAESLHKGQRVIATGRLRQSTWATEYGEKRTSIDLDVDEVGPSLRWAMARVTKVTRDTATAGSDASGDLWATPTTGQDSAPAWRPKPTPVPANAGVPGFTDNGAADKPPY